MPGRGWHLSAGQKEKKEDSSHTAGLQDPKHFTVPTKWRLRLMKSRLACSFFLVDSAPALFGLDVRVFPVCWMTFFPVMICSLHLINPCYPSLSAALRWTGCSVPGATQRERAWGQMPVPTTLLTVEWRVSRTSTNQEEQLCDFLTQVEKFNAWIKQFVQQFSLFKQRCATAAHFMKIFKGSVISPAAKLCKLARPPSQEQPTSLFFFFLCATQHTWHATTQQTMCPTKTGLGSDGWVKTETGNESILELSLLSLAGFE